MRTLTECGKTGSIPNYPCVLQILNPCTLPTKKCTLVKERRVDLVDYLYKAFLEGDDLVESISISAGGQSYDVLWCERMSDNNMDLASPSAVIAELDNQPAELIFVRQSLVASKNT
jgi:hypothetical protein